MTHSIPPKFGRLCALNPRCSSWRWILDGQRGSAGGDVGHNAATVVWPRHGEYLDHWLESNTGRISEWVGEEGRIPLHLQNIFEIFLIWTGEMDVERLVIYYSLPGEMALSQGRKPRCEGDGTQWPAGPWCAFALQSFRLQTQSRCRCLGKGRVQWVCSFCGRPWPRWIRCQTDYPLSIHQPQFLFLTDECTCENVFIRIRKRHLNQPFQYESFGRCNQVLHPSAGLPCCPLHPPALWVKHLGSARGAQHRTGPPCWWMDGSKLVWPMNFNLWWRIRWDRPWTEGNVTHLCRIVVFFLMLVPKIALCTVHILHNMTWNLTVGHWRSIWSWS